jgi:hypothetical protein
MALSIAELEVHTAEFLPAREVMSSRRCNTDDCGGHGGDSFWVYSDPDNVDQDNTANQIGLLNVNALNNIAVLNFQG